MNKSASSIPREGLSGADALALSLRAEVVLARLVAVLPPMAHMEPDWSAAAWRWVVNKRSGVGTLVAVPKVSTIQLNDLRDIDEQKARLVANTEQFLAGRPAQ